MRMLTIDNNNSLLHIWKLLREEIPKDLIARKNNVFTYVCSSGGYCQNNCLIWPYLFLQLFTIFSSIVFNAYILSEWWLIHRLVIYKFIHLVEISPMNSRHFDHHPTLHHQSDIQSKIRVEYQTHKISGFLLLRNSIILNV